MLVTFSKLLIAIKWHLHCHVKTGQSERKQKVGLHLSIDEQRLLIFLNRYPLRLSPRSKGRHYNFPISDISFTCPFSLFPLSGVFSISIWWFAGSFPWSFCLCYGYMYLRYTPAILSSYFELYLWNLFRQCAIWLVHPETTWDNEVLTI